MEKQTERIDLWGEEGRGGVLALLFLFALYLALTGIPWWLSGKESPANAGDPGLIPASGRSPGEGHGYPLQYSCLGNSMDREATVHGVTKESDTT